MSCYHRRHAPPTVSAAEEIETRYQNRNSEQNHAEALKEAYDGHNAIREAALRAIEVHKLETERLELERQNAQTEIRVKALEEKRREEARVQELENRERQANAATPPAPPRSTSHQPVPIATPTQQSKTDPLTQPPSTQSPSNTASTSQGQAQPANLFQTTPMSHPQIAQPANVFQSPTQPPATQPNNPFQTAPQAQSAQVHNPFQSTPPARPNPFQTTPVPQTQPTPPSNPFPQTPAPANPPMPNGTHMDQSPPKAIVVDRASGEHHIYGTDKYLGIHQELKALRREVKRLGELDKDFKKHAGNLRRSLKTRMGQFVVDKFQNKAPINEIFKALAETFYVNGPTVDPGRYMLDRPDGPVDGAVHNEEQLPILFIYLLNQFSKMLVKQFINEGFLRPAMADSIGVVAVQIFCCRDLLWRGKTLIDILMAKYRHSCPVLFGIRGSEETEQGRARLGWKKKGGWVSAEEHRSSMMGLAAGYAGICLRDFSKAPSLKSPWHVSHFWQTLSCIVSTPPALRSPTQYIVAKSLLDGFEGMFLRFYGDAAVAAMAAICINFTREADAPGSAVKRRSAPVTALEFFAEKMHDKWGIRLS